jgi:hypothetical protein
MFDIEISTTYLLLPQLLPDDGVRDDLAFDALGELHRLLRAIVDESPLV